MLQGRCPLPNSTLRTGSAYLIRESIPRRFSRALFPPTHTDRPIRQPRHLGSISPYDSSSSGGQRQGECWPALIRDRGVGRGRPSRRSLWSSNQPNQIEPTNILIGSSILLVGSTCAQLLRESAQDARFGSELRPSYSIDLSDSPLPTPRGTGQKEGGGRGETEMDNNDSSSRQWHRPKPSIFERGGGLVKRNKN